MEWAEKMLKLLVKLELVDKFGMLPHSKLNMIWSMPETRREQKLGFLRLLEKYLLSYRFDAQQSIIPRLLKDGTRREREREGEREREERTEERTVNRDLKRDKREVEKEERTGE
jgi:hypothetical protein